MPPGVVLGGHLFLLSLVMTTLIIYPVSGTIATAIGSFLGNSGLLWSIGHKPGKLRRKESNLKRREDCLRMES